MRRTAAHRGGGCDTRSQGTRRGAPIRQRAEVPIGRRLPRNAAAPRRPDVTVIRVVRAVTEPHALHRVEHGAGEELVAFLPGLGGTTRYWRKRVSPLADRHRLLFMDLLGFGRSPKPRVRYSVERHVEALRGVLRGRGPVTLVGHSLGAILSVAYAARYPLEVRGLVLLSLPYFGNVEVAREHFGRMPYPHRWVYTNIALAAATCVMTRRVFGRLLPRLLADMPREVAEDLVQHTWRSSTSSLWEAVYRYDVAGDADRLDPGVPVRCVHGDRDLTAPLSGIRRLSVDRTGWALDVLPGVDHHPLLRDSAHCLRVIEGVAAPRAGHLI